jgi:LmbE family N-acetylglucosaminyl deacetylase
MSEVELEIGASMGSLHHIQERGARATGAPLSGIIKSGPTTDDPLNVDFTGVTLLATWAHPDDEAYLGAGLMTAVAKGGGRVVSVTASIGERGTDDPSATAAQRLGRTRRRELEQSLAVLGAEGPIMLGYPDGGCDQVPDRLGARRVASLIQEFRPQIVLSFGPDGVTGHRDHLAVGRWTALAVSAQGRPPALVTTSTASAWPDDIVERMHRIGAFLPGYPDDQIRAGDLQVTLTGVALETKLAALRSHRSQIGPLVTLLGDADYARLASAEAYRPSNAAAKAWLSPVQVARPI